jgi:hypothetical protein
MGKHWDTPLGKERREKSARSKPEQAPAPKGTTKPKVAPKSTKSAHFRPFRTARLLLITYGQNRI